MSWNHRCVRHEEPDGQVWYAIHEVYYDDDRNERTLTSDAVAAIGDTPDELREELERMIRAISKPALDFYTMQPVT